MALAKAAQVTQEGLPGGETKNPKAHLHENGVHLELPRVGKRNEYMIGLLPLDLRLL